MRFWMISSPFSPLAYKGFQLSQCPTAAPVVRTYQEQVPAYKQVWVFYLQPLKRQVWVLSPVHSSRSSPRRTFFQSWKHRSSGGPRIMSRWASNSQQRTDVGPGTLFSNAMSSRSTTTPQCRDYFYLFILGLFGFQKF